MDEYYYRVVVLMLLSYLTIFAFVLTVNLLSLGAVFAALLVGTALFFGSLHIVE